MPDFPEVSQDRLARTLRRLGFTVDTSKGKGGHYKVYGPSGKATIVPSHLHAKGTRHSIAKFIIAEGINFEAFLQEL